MKKNSSPQQKRNLSRKRSRRYFEKLPSSTAPAITQKPQKTAPLKLKDNHQFRHHSILRVRQLPSNFPNESNDDKSASSDYSDYLELSPLKEAAKESLTTSKNQLNKSSVNSSSPKVSVSFQRAQLPTCKDNQIQQNELRSNATQNQTDSASPTEQTPNKTSSPRRAQMRRTIVKLKSGKMDGIQYAIIRVGIEPVPLSGIMWISVAQGNATIFAHTLTAASDPILAISAPLSPCLLTISSTDAPLPPKFQNSPQSNHLHPDAETNNRVRKSLRFSSKDFYKDQCVLVITSASQDSAVWEASDGFQVSADLGNTLQGFCEIAGHPSLVAGDELVQGMSVLPQAEKHAAFEEWSQWRDITKRTYDFFDQGYRASDFKLLVCGSSGSGKSTFTRCMMNFLLTMFEGVVLIDSDVGQAEMSPPGLVAAFKATEMRIGAAAGSNRMVPLSARFFGDTTPREDPDEYARFVEVVCKEALEYAESHNYAVVVNSDGWTSGIGADLLNHLVTQIEPSHLAHLRLQNHEVRPAIEELVSGFSSDRTFAVVSPRSERDLGFSATLLRELNVAAYFGKELALNRVYCVNKKEVEIIFVEDKQLKINCGEWLNGCLVAIGRKVVVMERDVEDWEIEGFGIIRGTNSQNGRLYICTPVEQTVLEECDSLLVSGGVQLPQALFFVGAPKELVACGKVPYVLTGSVHTGEGMRSRGSLARK